MKRFLIVSVLTLGLYACNDTAAVQSASNTHPQIASEISASSASSPNQESTLSDSLPVSTKFGDQTPDGFVFDQDDVIQMDKYKNNQDMGYMASRMCMRNPAEECEKIYNTCYQTDDNSNYCRGYLMHETIISADKSDREGVVLAEQCMAGKAGYADKCKSILGLCENMTFGKNSSCNGFIAKVWSEGQTFDDVKAKVATIPATVPFFGYGSAKAAVRACDGADNPRCNRMSDFCDKHPRNAECIAIQREVDRIYRDNY